MRTLRSHSRAACATLLLAALVFTAGRGAAVAKVFVTAEEAVREAFPGAAAERVTSYLTDDQASRVTSLAGSPPSSKIVISWRAVKDGRPLGTAYLDTHLVRTLPESILVVVDPDGRVGKVEILSFDEPDEYLPRPRWLEQFAGRKLDPELSLGGALRGVTGATLSSRALASAVRRILATHAVLAATHSPGSAPPPSSQPSAASQPASVPVPPKRSVPER